MLLSSLPQKEVRGSVDVPISGIAFDSRRVGGNNLFVCLQGLASDGHAFAAAAVDQGAKALVVNRWVDVDAPQILVPDTYEALARLSVCYAGNPAEHLEVLGVTGTNGKTTVIHLMGAMAEAAGETAALLGTLGGRIGTHRELTGFTTPEAPVVQELLSEALDAGATWVAMEVSSHALQQRRTFATAFSAAVFTNLSRDHLDYHGDMDEYFEAKALLFDPEARGSDRSCVCVVPTGLPEGARLWERLHGPKVDYGFEGQLYSASNVEAHETGVNYRLQTPHGSSKVSLQLRGRFNVLNALSAQAAMMERGLPLEYAVSGAEALAAVPGRMEPVLSNAPFQVFVDFAHTPDALSAAMNAAREHARGRLLVVFGCGGDRDPGKRPQMGEVAESLADQVIITSDNPRSENPASIIQDIVAGMKSNTGIVEEDRAMAIEAALREAESGDVVLIAGKGHEAAQIVGDAKHVFNDKAEAVRVLGSLGWRVNPLS